MSKSKNLQKIMFLIMAVFYLAFSLVQPIKVHAHDAYFLQVLIDENKYLYQATVLQDKASSLWAKESKHYEASLGDFSDLARWDGGRKTVPSDESSYEESSTSGNKEMIFTFAPKKDGGLLSSKAINHAEAKDADRVYEIMETLVPGLNDALLILNNNKQFNSIEELIQMSSKLSAGGTIGNFTVSYGSRMSDARPISDIEKNKGITENDYVLITNNTTGDQFEFVYRMPKGYKTKGNWDNRLYDPRRNFSNDAEYISWHMLMYQGNYSYFAKGWTSYNASEIAKLGPLEEAIVDFFQNTLNGLRGLLGLYSANELIYNDGIRGSSAWLFGIMPASWEDNITVFFWVFQGFAWSLIALAMVKLLVQRNLATINTSMRISLMDSIQDLLITGFVLASLLPLINMFMFLNVRLVEVFGALAPDFENLSGLNNYSNAFAGVILQIFYFIVQVYLNFVYIIRSISVAILITASPLFVVTIAFGGKWKPLFGIWFRELLSNIFIQSFHAFIFAFFLTTTWSSRGIEMAVLLFALIPLTEFFRSLTMGQGAGIAGSLGMKATLAGGALVGGSLKAINNRNNRKERSENSSSNRSSSSESSGTASYSSGDGGTQRINRNSQTINNGYGNQQSSGYSATGGSAFETVQAQDEKDVPLDIYTRGTQANASNDDITAFNNYVGHERMSGTKAGFKDGAKSIGKALVNKNHVKGAGKVALGATTMAMGAGAILALGGSNAGAAFIGGAIAGKGLEVAGKGAGQSVKTATSGVVSGVANIAQGIQHDRNVSKIHDDINDPIPTDSSATGTATSTVDDYLHINSLPNNSLEVHRDGTVLSEQGIVRANEDSQGNAVYTYDMGRLDEADRANIEYYANVFQNGTDQEKAWLRANGIENVRATPQGQYRVYYNNVGKEQLGIRNVRTVGEGNRRRIVETKNFSDPISTRKTINVPPMPSQPSPIVNQHGQPFSTTLDRNATPPNTSHVNTTGQSNTRPVIYNQHGDPINSRNQNSQTNKNNNPNNNQFNK